MVSGSVAIIRYQSTSALSMREWRFLTFRRVLSTAPPKTVMLERGMACFPGNRTTRM